MEGCVRINYPEKVTTLCDNFAFISLLMGESKPSRWELAHSRCGYCIPFQRSARKVASINTERAWGSWSATGQRYRQPDRAGGVMLIR